MNQRQRIPDCHQDRKHCANGLCRSCYTKLWTRRKKRAAREASRRPCALCNREFLPPRSNSRHCGETCRRAQDAIDRARERGTLDREARYVTRDQAIALQIIGTARDRGCKMVGIRTAGHNFDWPYYCAWKVGDGLWVVRVRWPDAGDDEEYQAA